MRYMVVFSHLEGISNVALLLSLMVHAFKQIKSESIIITLPEIQYISEDNVTSVSVAQCYIIYYNINFGVQYQTPTRCP